MEKPFPVRFVSNPRLDNPKKPDIERPKVNLFVRRTTIEARLMESHIPSHPLASLAGKYDDEPLWDDFMAAIQEYRQGLNEQEDTTE